MSFYWHFMNNILYVDLPITKMLVWIAEVQKWKMDGSGWWNWMRVQITPGWQPNIEGMVVWGSLPLKRSAFADDRLPPAVTPSRGHVQQAYWLVSPVFSSTCPTAGMRSHPPGSQPFTTVCNEPGEQSTESRLAEDRHAPYGVLSNHMDQTDVLAGFCISVLGSGKMASQTVFRHERFVRIDLRYILKYALHLYTCIQSIKQCKIVMCNKWLI